MIVIDVGCARYGGDYSLERLYDEFHPDILFGFDPEWTSDMLPDPQRFKDTALVIQAAAAWTRSGTVNFRSDGLGSWVSSDVRAPQVPCIDLAAFIRSLPADQEIVLKMDCEGSEYDLLQHLILTRTDELLKLAWVEWHTKGIDNPLGRREAIEEAISCEITEWRW